MIDCKPAEDFNASELKTLTGGRRYVYEVMVTGSWWTVFELQTEVQRQFSVHFAETCISARIRDLRKWEYGSHIVQRRIRNGRTCEYRLVTPHSPKADNEPNT